MNTLQQQWCYDYKADKGCKVCGAHYPLEFHHRDPSLKRFTLGTGVKEEYPLEELFAEAAKCDVLCHEHHIEAHNELRRLGLWD